MEQRLAAVRLDLAAHQDTSGDTFTIHHLDELAQSLARNITDTRKRLADTGDQVDAPFKYAERLAQLVRRQEGIEDALDLTKNRVPGQVEADQPDPVVGIEDARGSARVTA